MGTVREGKRRETCVKKSDEESSDEYGNVRARRRKAAVKRPAAKKKRTSSPIARVTRVMKEVAQQATSAVSEGMETVKEMGENLVERVTS